MTSFDRHRTRRQGGMLAALLLSLLIVGCAEQPTMLVIRGAAVASVNCPSDLANNTSDVFMTQGVLDISLAGGYALAPLIANIAPNSSSVGAKTQQQSQGQVAVWTGLGIEGNMIILSEAQISFEFLNEVPESIAGAFEGYDLPLGGIAVDPAGTVTLPMYVLNAFHIEVLRTVIQPGFTAYLMVKVRVLGTSSSQTDVESNELEFPISICNGCLRATECGENETTATNACVPVGQDFLYCPPEEETAP